MHGGNDWLYAADVPESIWVLGGDGSDTAYGGYGNDYLEAGGSGYGGYGGYGEFLSGGTGDDILLGGDFNDYLDGGSGDDTIFGGSGNDWLYGQAGSDALDGGAVTTTSMQGMDTAGMAASTCPAGMGTTPF